MNVAKCLAGIVWEIQAAGVCAQVERGIRGSVARVMRASSRFKVQSWSEVGSRRKELETGPKEQNDRRWSMKLWAEFLLLRYLCTLRVA